VPLALPPRSTELTSTMSAFGKTDMPADPPNVCYRG
jgi:hypothetical protein